jgi:hypothetical protein
MQAELAEIIEVKDKIRNARNALLEAVQALDERIADERSDIAEVSDGAFVDLVDMLRKLSADYCIETLCEDALEEA